MPQQRRSLMAIGDHLESSFAQKRREFALDPERIRASAAPMRELVDIFRSVDGFDENEYFALLDRLKEVKLEAIRAPRGDDMYSDVTQRLKFLAAQSIVGVERLLPQPESARRQEFDVACKELKDKVRAWAGEYREGRQLS